MVVRNKTIPKISKLTLARNVSIAGSMETNYFNIPHC